MLYNNSYHPRWTQVLTASRLGSMFVARLNILLVVTLLLVVVLLWLFQRGKQVAAALCLLIACCLPACSFLQYMFLNVNAGTTCTHRHHTDVLTSMAKKGSSTLKKESVCSSGCGSMVDMLLCEAPVVFAILGWGLALSC